MAIILKDAGYHEILSITPFPLELIELAGRTSYQSEDKITVESARKFVKMLIDRGHESVLEHVSMTVRFSNVSRGFTHELVRHRLMAITQESTRYTDESSLRVVIPPGKDQDEEITLTNDKGIIYGLTFRNWANISERMYKGLLAAGWHYQDARQVLPIGITAQIVVTANFREWRHIFRLRTAPDAHWEIRRVMTNLLKEVKERVPVVFDDIRAGEQND